LVERGQISLKLIWFVVAFFAGLLFFAAGLYGAIGFVMSMVEDSFTIKNIVATLILLFCSGLGLHVIIYTIKRRKQIKRLLEHGRLINAQIMEIPVYASAGMNAHIVAIEEGHVFRSENMNIKQFRKAKVNGYVDVYVDKINPSVYFVDLDSL
jgi:hypothetical protein